MGREGIESLISQSGIRLESFYILPADQLFEKLEELDAETSHILVGGGDGTITQAAKTLGAKDLAFGILPMGTMNLLAKDLNIPLALEDSIAAYAAGSRTATIDKAYVNNKMFLCSAALGVIPEAADYREDHRKDTDSIVVPRMTLFVLDKMDRSKNKNYKLTIDGKSHQTSTSIFVVSNNLFAPSDNLLAPSMKRQSLSGNALGAYCASPASFWDKIRLLSKFQIGGWRNDPVVREWKGQTMSVHSNQNEERVSLDGETLTLKTPLNFWINPKSLKLLVPKSEKAA